MATRSLASDVKTTTGILRRRIVNSLESVESLAIRKGQIQQDGVKRRFA